MRALLLAVSVAIALTACTAPPPGTPGTWGVTNRPGLYGGGG